MLFLLTNRTRAGLSAEQFGELATLAKAFYANLPETVQLRGEWARDSAVPLSGARDLPWLIGLVR